MSAAVNGVVFGGPVPRSLNFVSEDVPRGEFGFRISFLINGSNLGGVVSGYVGVRNPMEADIILSRVGTRNCGCSAGNTVAITIYSTIVPPRGGTVVTRTRGRISIVHSRFVVNLHSGRRHCRRILHV